MSIYTHVPPLPLSRYVEWFWYYRDFVPDHDREHVLPNGSFELIINLEERPRRLFDRQNPSQHQSFRRGWLSGVHTEYLIIDALRNSTMMGVHFRPGGAAPFLGLPAGELGDAVVELDDVWGNRVWEWRDKLGEAATPQAKFKVLEKLLVLRLDRTQAAGRAEESTHWALQRFLHQPQVITIRAVSGALGMSQKHFIETFRRNVGVTPKRFCRIRRFQQALSQIQARQKVDWADVVCSCGYYDQAHFINEFSAFCGMSPSAYLTQRLEGDPNFARAAN